MREEGRDLLYSSCPDLDLGQLSWDAEVSSAMVAACPLALCRCGVLAR